MRTTLVFISWLFVINLWLALEDLTEFLRFDSFTLLSTMLCLIYTAIPLGAAFLIGLTGVYGFELHRLLRASLAGLVCGVIVLTFFIQTSQLDLNGIIWVVVFTLAGASIGFVGRKKRDA